jgi:hypothetical protein
MAREDAPRPVFPGRGNASEKPACYGRNGGNSPRRGIVVMEEHRGRSLSIRADRFWRGRCFAVKKTIAFLLVIFFFTSGAAADIIIFNSGSAKEGIIEAETPTSIKLRVKNAVMGFSRDNIKEIEYASDEENRQLDIKWKEQEEQKKEERRQRKEAKKRFEKQQRDKGLVKEGKKWIPEKRKVELNRERARRSVDAQRDAISAGESEEDEEEQEDSEVEEELGGEGFDDISIDALNINKKGLGSMLFDGRVTNKGERTAGTIFLRIDVYNKAGRVIRSKTQRVNNLAPQESKKVRVPIQLKPEQVKRHDFVVTNVLWRGN